MSLKNHVHVICHLDDFTIYQTESFVVIQYTIHVLDPVWINRSIKDNPLPHLFGVLVGAFPEETSNYTVLELLGNEIVSAVQLFDSHALWIDYKAFGLRLFKRLIVYCNQIQRLFKGNAHRCLACICWSNNHQAMPALYHVIQLKDLLGKLLTCLIIELQHGVVERGNLSQEFPCLETSR